MKHMVTVAALFCFLAVHAQSPRLYTMQQGLPNTRISQLAIDHENFIWVSTNMGLARFDGNNFCSFKADNKRSFTLGDNSVTCIHEDRTHKHWVGAGDGLYHFCRTENKFEYYNISIGTDTLKKSVSHIISHPQRNDLILVSTSGYGIYVFNTETRTFDENLTASISQRLTRWHVVKMLVDKNNNLWVLNPRGVRIISLDTPDVVELRAEPDVQQMINSTPFESIVEDKERGVVYLSGSQRGLLECDTKTMTIKRLPVTALQQLSITSLLFTPERQLLIGTEAQGLYSYDIATGRVEEKYYPNCPVELQKSKIHGMLFDDQHNLWLALYQKGVMVIPWQDANFVYSAVSDAADYENIGCVSSFATLSNGNRVICTDGGGVLLKFQSGASKKYNMNNSALETNSVLCCTKDMDGNVYLGTYNYGIYCIDGENRLSRVKGLEQFDRTPIMALIYDSISNFLFIGTNGDGVFSFDLKTHEITRRFDEKYNKWITALFIDSRHTLWVGTVVGLLSLDLNHNVVQERTFPIDGRLSFKSFDEDGEAVWMASQQGLVRYDKQKNVFAFLKPGAVCNDDELLALAVGNDGNVWFTTSESMGCYKIKENNFVAYASSDVSLVGNFNTASVTEREDGTLIFGGDNGFISFNPNKISADKKPMKEIYFTHLWINNIETEYVAGADDNVLDASLWHSNKLTLPAGTNSFTLDFAVQEYSNPMRINYEYRLLGYEEEWRKTRNNSHTANYSNVPWGTYDFQVRAYANEDTSNVSFKQLHIVIVTPWYASWWAWLVYLLAFGTVVWFICRYFIERNSQAEKRLMLERNEQIKEAKLRLFTSISHELKTPLTLILSPLKKLLDKKTDNATHSIYDLMYRNALRISMLVNQLMDVRKIDNGQMKLQMQELPLKDFLTGIMQYFNNIVSIHQIDFSLEFECGEDVAVWADPNQADKIFFNLLSNAFKYTHDRGKVQIKVSRRKNDGFFDDDRIREYLVINVFNSGSSIEVNDMKHIFERFYQGKNNAENAGSGVGLNLAQQLTALHHGQISVSNVGDAGVEFSVSLPLGNSHLSDEEIAVNTSDGASPVDVQSDLVTDRNEEREQQLRELQVQQLNEEEMDPEEKKAVTVLLVDDDREFLDYLQQELCEYTTVLSQSGNDAWCQLLTYAPDVVVTDLKMADGDGYELCNRIKRNPDTEHIPVIVMTSEVADGTEEKTLLCQADKFLSKPLNVPLLKAAIGQSMKVREMILNKMRRSEMGYDYDRIKMCSADSKLMQRVMDTITKFLGDSDFSVEQLSVEVGISRVHLNRKLKVLIGTSPSALIKSIRLKQAAFLLVNNNVTIAEIAYAVGFSSPSYFTSNFIDYFGMTPKEFIANYLENPNDEKLKKLLD